VSSADSAVRQVIKNFDKTQKKAAQLRQKIRDLPEDAREIASAVLVDLANDLCQKYGLTIPEARQFLHEMLTSV